MPAGNPAPSRAHRELALPLRRHKDRPRFGRLHDCGLGELGFAGGHRNIAALPRHWPRRIISRTTSLWGSMRPEFSPCLTAASIEPPKAPPRS
jgi:hypothetical protein